MSKSTLYPFTYADDAEAISASLMALGESLASLRRTLHMTLKLPAHRAVVAGLRRDIDRAERYARNGRQRLRQIAPKAMAAEPWRVAA